MLTRINSIEGLERALQHPYRSGEYFYVEETGEILDVSSEMSENKDIIESHAQNGLYYGINYVNELLYTENGNKIEPIYGRP